MEQAKVCRLCLLSEVSQVSIKDPELQSKLQDVFNFEFSEDESLPCGACPDCISTVSEFHTFHESVRANQCKLKTIFSTVVKLPPLEDVKEEPSYALDNSVDQVMISNDVESCKEDPTVEESNSPLEQEVNEEHDESTTSSEERKTPIKRKRKKNATTKLKLAKKKELDEQLIESHEEKIRRIEEDNRKIQEFFTMNCESCSETFQTFDRLQRHTRKVHSARGSIRCCNRVFYKKCKIIDHINSHLNPDQFHCDLCNKSYNNKYYLDLHNLKKHSINEEKPFKCEKCDQGFPKEYLLKAHLNTHIQAECNICHKILASASTLRSHLLNMHSGDSKRICDTCGQEFRTKLAMERHIKQHMGINPIERVQCHICSKWVNGKPNLKVHIKTVHNEESQSVPCDVCNQVYPNLRALSSHKRRVHVEEKYECEFCGKKFKRSIYLKEHRASHTGQSLYSCDVCGMMTNSNANLYSHKKSKHPDEWMEAKKKAMAIAYG